MATGCGSPFDNFRRQCIGGERPKLKDLYKHVTPCYAAQWEDIGIYLDIELGYLETIKADHPGDTSSCCKDLWKKWLKLDPNATWEKLFTAIDDCTAASSSTATGNHSTTSEPSATVKCSPLDVSRLKARYIKLLPTGKTDWPKHKVTRYVRLAIVEKEDVTLRDENLNELTRLTLQGDIDKILKKKQPLGDLKDIFHYNDEPCPRLILIMGGPGIGKTTLANELCIRWARDGFLAEDFVAVLLIPLRSVQQRSLEEVIVKHIGEENYQQMKKSAGSRCLIILEGWDELAIDHRQSDPFLFGLIKECTVLEEATTLITSRPHACEGIDAGRKIEVVGFGNDEIREFVENSFPQDTQSVQEFLQQLDEYPQLHSLCYIPMNLVMVVDIFQCSKNKLPSTLTELYKVFIVMTLERQVKKENVAKKPALCTVRAADSVEETLCVMLRGIPKETVGIVLCLSRLAYRGFFDWGEYCHTEGGCHTELREGKNITVYTLDKDWKEPKIIFTESDLIQCDIEVTSDFDGFGLLKATQTHQLFTDINTYSFNHLTIQEYFCAVYISLQSQQEQLRLLREHFHEYPNVFTYVCGLTGLAASEMFQFVYTELTSPEETSDNQIMALRCINESKQGYCSGSYQSVSPFTLNISLNRLLPYDCLCLSNVLLYYPVSQLKIECCSIGNKEVELLVKHYPNKNSTGQLLEELSLIENDLTSEGMEHVMKIVRTSSSTLRMLGVSYNNIGDDGMAIISEALQHNKSLTTLRVGKCGLSVKGAVYISQLLNVTHTLQVLYLGYNDIGDDGMAVISEALQHSKSLTILRVEQCGLSVTGAVYINLLLNVTHTLQELYLDNNDIGDDGMAVISEALQHNKSLTTLWVGQCGFSVTGAISISKMMTVNHSLQLLYMHRNNVGDVGISAIAEALGNCKINALDIGQCGITLTGATSLAAALSSNHTIRGLFLKHNPITIEGALLIVKSAVNNTVCQSVGVDDEYKNDEIWKMMEILKYRNRQEDDSSSSEIYNVSEDDSSEDIQLEETLQFQLLQSIREKNINDNYFNPNDDNSSSEELVHTLPTIAGDGPTASASMETNQNILEGNMRQDGVHNVSEVDSTTFEDIPLEELLLQSQIMENIMKNNDNSSSEELVHTLPVIAGDGSTVYNMEMSLMNQSEDDDHSLGQEETRGYHSDEVPSRKDHHL